MASILNPLVGSENRRGCWLDRVRKTCVISPLDPVTRIPHRCRNTQREERSRPPDLECRHLKASTVFLDQAWVNLQDPHSTSYPRRHHPRIPPCSPPSRCLPEDSPRADPASDLVTDPRKARETLMPAASLEVNDRRVPRGWLRSTLPTSRMTDQGIRVEVVRLQRKRFRLTVDSVWRGRQGMFAFTSRHAYIKD